LPATAAIPQDDSSAASTVPRPPVAPANATLMYVQTVNSPV
jgi:hypothetical protein